MKSSEREFVELLENTLSVELIENTPSGKSSESEKSSEGDTSEFHEPADAVAGTGTCKNPLAVSSIVAAAAVPVGLADLSEKSSEGVADEAGLPTGAENLAPSKKRKITLSQGPKDKHARLIDYYTLVPPYVIMVAPDRQPIDTISSRGIPEGYIGIPPGWKGINPNQAPDYIKVVAEKPKGFPVPVITPYECPHLSDIPSTWLHLPKGWTIYPPGTTTVPRTWTVIPIDWEAVPDNYVMIAPSVDYDEGTLGPNMHVNQHIGSSRGGHSGAGATKRGFAGFTEGSGSHGR